MADTTITALGNATAPLSGTERVPMDQNGVTVDASTLQIAQTLPDATTSAAGKMSAADKTKLNAIEEGATANTTEGIQDAAAALLIGGTHSGISFNYNDAANRIDATVTAAGATDLSIANRGASTLDVASSTGADVTLPAATNTQAGLATAAQVAKIEGVATGATANATDSQLRDRQTHTGEQAISTITGLLTSLAGKETAGAAAAAVAAHEASADPHPGYLTPAEANAAYATAAQGAKADTAIQPENAALSDAREWSASTISQAEAEAGTATTRRAFTAELVRQAIVAWWNGATSSFGRSWVALADAAAGTEALNAFSTTLKGLVPAPGTATGKVLSDSGSWVSLSGGGDALVASPLSQFAATTSDQLRGVISDETGTGALVFADAPTLTLSNATGLPAAGISDSTIAGRALLTAANVGAQRTALELKAGALIAIHVGTTAPSSPAVGDLWVDTT
jgi:hypothetical protein